MEIDIAMMRILTVIDKKSRYSLVMSSFSPVVFNLFGFVVHFRIPEFLMAHNLKNVHWLKIQVLEKV